MKKRLSNIRKMFITLTTIAAISSQGMMPVYAEEIPEAQEMLEETGMDEILMETGEPVPAPGFEAGSNREDQTFQLDDFASGATDEDHYGLTIRSKQEIKDFIKSHPASASETATWESKPSAKSPYALGRISEQTRTSALNMLNSIRYIAGLNADITSDEEYEQLAQAAVLADAAYGQISHYPGRVDDMDQELYDLGAKGASSCNLGWSSGGQCLLNSTILQGWTGDSDSSNIDRIGHRRWVLYPGMKKTGFGAISAGSGSYTAMYAFDGFGYGKDAPMVAWPAENMPIEFFNSTRGYANAWSFSTGNVESTTEVQVSVTRRSDNKSWKFSEASSNGYFNVENSNYGQSGCIIFRPNGISSYKSGEVFDVAITGLSCGDVNYTVNFFSVNAVPSKVTSVSLNPNTLTLTAGQTAEIKAELLPGDADDVRLEWKSSDEGVASVDQNGIVTALSDGKATISAASSDSGAAGYCYVYVGSVVPESHMYVAGEKIDIKSLYYKDAPSIAKYRAVLTDTDTNAASYAAVTNKGVLTCKKAGNVTIIPQEKVGKAYRDLELLSLNLTIIPKPTLKFTKPLTYEGQSIDANEYFLNDWAKNGYKVIEWTSAKPAVASIDENGIITAKSSGTATIKAIFCKKNADGAVNTLSVSAKLSVKVPSFAKPSITMQTGQTLTLTMKNVNKQSDAEFHSDHPESLNAAPQLDKKGEKTGKAVLKAVNAGNFVLTAVIDEKEINCEVIVTPPEIAKSSIRIKIGKKGTVALKNTKYKKNEVVWVSEDPDIATVSTGGEIVGKGKGTVKIYTETGGVKNECDVTVE